MKSSNGLGSGSEGSGCLVCSQSPQYLPCLLPTQKTHPVARQSDWAADRVHVEFSQDASVLSLRLVWGVVGRQKQGRGEMNNGRWGREKRMMQGKWAWVMGWEGERDWKELWRQMGRWMDS